MQCLLRVSHFTGADTSTIITVVWVAIGSEIDLLLSVGRGRVWHLRCSRRSSGISSIGRGRIWKSSLRGSVGIPQIAVGCPGRVWRGTADTGEVQGRWEDDAEGRSRARPAAEVDVTVGISIRRGVTRGSDLRSAHSVWASESAVGTALWTVIIIGGVLTVTMPGTAAVTTRVLLEPCIDFFRVARRAVPFDNHANDQYESDEDDDSDDAEGHANAGFVCEKTRGGRCWSGTIGGHGAEGVRRVQAGRAGATAEVRYSSRLVGI